MVSFPKITLFANRLNLDHIGMFGHSYGGATTAETMAQDEWIKAGVSLEEGEKNHLLENDKSNSCRFFILITL